MNTKNGTTEDARMLGRKTLFVPCRIEQGGFSSERTFEIETSDGGKLVGAAHIEYFRDSENRKLPDDVPAYGSSIQGFVQCRIIQRANDSILIDVPSSDVVHVPKDAVLELEA